MNTKLFENIKNEILDFVWKNPKSIVIIRWTTASGKTALSLKLSKFLDTEIISSDSRQIFKYMDIWTDKISAKIRQNTIHHQIDILEPNLTYTAGQWQSDTQKIISDIFDRQKIPMIVWWTGLYIDTIYKNFQMQQIDPDYEFRKKLFEQEEKQSWYLRNHLNSIDPISASQIHPNSTRYIVRAIEIYKQTWKPKSQIMTSQNLSFPILMIWLRKDKPLNDTQIIQRIQDQIQNGWIEEVEFLLSRWYGLELQSMQSIWYRQIANFINWTIQKQEMIDQIVFATIRYAKKQRTWLRKYIRDGETNPRENVKYMLCMV